VAGILELPPLAHAPGWLLDRAVLRPMRWATQGTVVAMREAFQSGFVANLGGGFHHARPDAGEGFCVYSDIGIGICQVRREGLLPEDSRIAYIDLDAHQGNGVCHVFRGDRRVFVFDMYNAEIYPFLDHEARERIDCDVRLQSGCTDDDYLGLLERHLPAFLDSISKSQPVGLAIYNAGTDIVSGDPLGQMRVSPDAVVQRDAFVLDALRSRGIPTVMLPSGGYTDQSYRLIADSLIRQLEPLAK